MRKNNVRRDFVYSTVDDLILLFGGVMDFAVEIGAC